MYRSTNSNGVVRLSDNAFIPFDPANTDYLNFKREIEAGTAELLTASIVTYLYDGNTWQVFSQDADGQPMSAADATAYVRTLP